MPLPVRMICTKCQLEAIHEWVGGWLSTCCRAKWEATPPKKILSFSEANAHRLTGGGYRPSGKYARLRRRPA